MLKYWNSKILEKGASHNGGRGMTATQFFARITFEFPFFVVMNNFNVPFQISRDRITEVTFDLFFMNHYSMFGQIHFLTKNLITISFSHWYSCVFSNSIFRKSILTNVVSLWRHEKSFSLPKVLLQISHLDIFLFVMNNCVQFPISNLYRCYHKDHIWNPSFSHGQSYCMFYSLFLENILLQILQILCFLWSLTHEICISKSFICPKVFLQLSHLNSFSFFLLWTISMCHF